jgi:uncharacterized protein (UPF0335 family)
LKELIEKGGKGMSKEVQEALDSYLEKIEKLEQEMKQTAKKKEGDDDYFQYVTVDQVDGKMQSMLEKLKNDNQLLWKETVKMAEKTFSEKGITDSMDLMPGVLQGVSQLKTTINTLEARESVEPKP